MGFYPFIQLTLGAPVLLAVDPFVEIDQRKQG